MALTPNFCIRLTDDCGVFQFEDKTNWGSPEEDRGAGANVLIVAHVTDKEVEEFLQVDSTPYDSKLIYPINNKIDGHYHFEILRFLFYDTNITYNPEVKDSNGVIITSANLIYYPPTLKFYKAIEVSNNILPDAVNGSTYWQEITDFTIDSIRTNTTIRVFVYDGVALCRSQKCIRDSIISNGCGCEDPKKINSSLRKEALLAGTKSLADNREFTKAETNIRMLERMCPSC